VSSTARKKYNSLPTKPPTAPTKPPTAPTKLPTATTPTAPTSSGPKCTIPGCTVADKVIEYLVSGVTVTKAQVQCGGNTYYSCTLTGNKYHCDATSTCTNPIPWVNDKACAISFSTISQSCKSSSTSNTWWQEFVPPGTGWSSSLASIKCQDGRFFACPNDYGTKVACPITERECFSPTPYYNNAVCPASSALLDEGVSSSDGILSTPAIIGICVAIFVILLVVVILIILKKKKMSEREEIV